VVTLPSTSKVSASGALIAEDAAHSNCTFRDATSYWMLQAEQKETTTPSIASKKGTV